MRTSYVLVAAVTLAAPLSACKSKQDDFAVPMPPASGTAKSPVEEYPPAVDALTPPPRPRPPDLSAPPPRADTMNGHPNGPKQAEFDAVQLTAQDKIQSCLSAIPGTTALPNGVARVAVKYQVANDGRPKDVSISGEVPPETIACSTAAVEGVTFPKFEGATVGNTFTLSYSRAPAVGKPLP